MSETGEDVGQLGFDSTDHQTSYIYTPFVNLDSQKNRPQKRRKISQRATNSETLNDNSNYTFPTLLNGAENLSFVKLRQRLFEESWAYADDQIQAILRDANETTLSEVTAFVNENEPKGIEENIPTALIVTGPNIASQDFLFHQLAGRLRTQTNGLVVVLRSGDASNLKTVLKKLIRDATNQKGEEDITRHDGRKLLNYDLQVLHDYLGTSRKVSAIVAFQDSEAFDSGLLAELILLFKSWLDRIPFVLLFGIATSVELFQERLSRGASHCLYGAKFEVEEATKTIQTVFQRVVSGPHPGVRLGSTFITGLLDRQSDHVQSLQAFVSALKYAHMCHFYANPLSVIGFGSNCSSKFLKSLQQEHLEAIRMLPSFKILVEQLVDEGEIDNARLLFDSDKALLEVVEDALLSKEKLIIDLLRKLRGLSTVIAMRKNSPVAATEIYILAFSGSLSNSEIVMEVLDSIKRITPDEALALLEVLELRVTDVDPEDGISGWREEANMFREEIVDIKSRITALRQGAELTGSSLRSRYTQNQKSLRTTVVAQRVQLSKQESIISKEDASFTDAVDDLLNILRQYFKFEDPRKQFLHEAWLYDLKSPSREVFTPRPRYAIERALSVPHDYLGCTCCKGSEGLSSSQPPTAILYQLYLETGGLINVFDLWSAFFTIIGGDDGEDCDERTTLALFYRALADLRLLGLVKQSRKKTDHLAKLAWKGL